MAKGSSGAQTTTTTSDPWKAQQPYLLDVMNEAKRTYQGGAGDTYFPGETVVPFSTDTQAGMDQIRRIASQQPAGLGAATDVASQAMQGQQTNRNDVLQRAASGGMRNPILAALMGLSMGTTTAGIDKINGAGEAVNPYLASIGQAGSAQTNQRGILDVLQSGRSPTAGVGDMVASGSRDVTAGNPALERMASGQELGGNPLLDAMYDRAAAKVRDNTNAAFSMAGRYGSGAHGSTLGESLGGLATDMYGQAYESERGRQLSAIDKLRQGQASDIDRETSALGAAAGFNAADLSRMMEGGSITAGLDQADASRNLSAQSLLGQLGEAGFGRQAAAGSTLAGLQQNDLARRLQAQSTAAGVASDDRNAQLGAASDINTYGLNQTGQGLQAAQLLPMLRQLGMAGGQDLLNLGQLQEGKSGEYVQDALNRWNFAQQAPWDNLGRYSGIIGGLGDLGGTSTSTAPKQKTNSLLGGLSGAAGGAGIASALSMGAGGWPLALLGGLAGLFG